MLWDKIIPRAKLAKQLSLKLNNMKYPLRDVHNRLLGQRVKLTLKAEIMPVVGPMRYVSLNETYVTMPSKYNM